MKSERYLKAGNIQATINEQERVLESFSKWQTDQTEQNSIISIRLEMAKFKLLFESLPIGGAL